MHPRLAALSLFLASMACGPSKVGESCDLLGNTVCGRCFPAEKTDCLLGFLTACCSGASCELPVRDPGKVLQCNDLLKSASCASLLQGNLPSSCRGVASP
jgi:hypothetical protein